MAQVKKGDNVTINYIGKLEDGSVFDSTYENDSCTHDECDTEECDSGDCGCGCETGPMTLTVGGGDFFEQVEEALVGMTPGEKSVVKIDAEDAFGEYDENKVFTVPRSDLPEDLNPEVGDELMLSDENDESIGVLVTEISADSVTFDANHPLAGEDLTFELELVSIN